MSSEWVNPYSDNETALVIELKKEGLIGQRLSDAFRKQFPARSHRSVLNKVQSLRRHKIIREKKRCLR